VGRPGEDRSRTRTLPGEGAPAVEASRFYLLAVQGGSSEMFHLPATGVVVIGRSDEADLRVDDDTASRSHAKIFTADGVARLVDLGSHNGTFVNGERVDGTRPLASGDVISIGAVTLVLHAERRAPEARPILDAAALRVRLVEEIERATRYQRPMALVSLGLPAGREQREVAATIAAGSRLIDVVGFVADAQLAVIMPEAGPEARVLAERLARLAGGARIGIGTCPDDALDADTLLAVARAAAAAAQPGQVATAAAAVRELGLGDRTIVLADPALVRLFDLIARLASSDLPILILGETGAGKEGAARAVHHGSKRADGPFVTVNCAAIPENLVESELFGFEKGAFTGAVAAKAGKLEAASGGTLFLDEIGELPPSVQAKLLRAFEEKRITRLGDVKERAVDLRIVAATNRALEEEVKAGRFRQDLFFRLGAARVVLPPLRDRPREIPILARRFLAAASTQAGRDVPTLSPAALARLAGYRWPGNVRELRNTMEYVAATADDCVIEPWHLPDTIAAVESEPDPGAGEVEAAPAAAPAGARGFRPLTEELRELERTRMVEALAAGGGVQRRAAELIGMPLRTFVMKVKQYGISPRAKAET
jgi:DNA-binding NtrC family response regulator